MIIFYANMISCKIEEKTPYLALIWQIMRAYTLSVLTSLANSNSPIIEKEIVAWVNQKLESAGKTSSIRSFQDSKISDGKVVIDLVDSIKPGSVNYDNIKNGDSEEVSFYQLIGYVALSLSFYAIIRFDRSGSSGERKIISLFSIHSICRII